MVLLVLRQLFVVSRAVRSRARMPISGTMSKCYGMDCFGTYFTHVQTCTVTQVRHGWCYANHGVGLGLVWGGMFTFLEHAQMFLHSCLMLRSRWGWGWGGVGCSRSLNMHTCSRIHVWCCGAGGAGVGWDVHVLRICTHVLVHRNMLDAMHLAQIKMHVSFLSQHECKLQQSWSGVGWGCSRSMTLHTSCMLRNSVFLVHTNDSDLFTSLGQACQKLHR